MELFQQTNDASSKGLFWFSESKVVAAGSLPDAMMEYTSLTRRLYARQLCGLYNPARYEAFRDLVNSTEDRLIVFYNFTEEMERLKGIAKGLNRPVSVLSGEEKNLDSYRYQHNSITFQVCGNLSHPPEAEGGEEPHATALQDCSEQHLWRYEG